MGAVNRVPLDIQGSARPRKEMFCTNDQQMALFPLYRKHSSQILETTRPKDSLTKLNSGRHLIFTVWRLWQADLYEFWTSLVTT